MSNLNWCYNRFHNWVIDGCCPKEAAAVEELYISGHDLYDRDVLGDLNILARFVNLHKLTFTYMYGSVNVLDAIEVISDMIWLRNLDISDNGLSELPPSVGQLVKLEELNLSYNEFKSVPDCVWDLGRLTALHVQYNNITSIPPAIGRLSQLMMLTACKNKICELADEICDLGALGELNVSANRLSSLPARFDALQGLTELNISDNMLDSVPPSIYKLGRLERLIIRGLCGGRGARRNRELDRFLNEFE